MKKKKLELELAATQKQLGVIPGIGAAGIEMDVGVNQMGVNHVYKPQSVSVPPVRLEKIVSEIFFFFWFLEQNSNLNF